MMRAVIAAVTVATAAPPALEQAVNGLLTGAELQAVITLKCDHGCAVINDADIARLQQKLNEQLATVRERSLKEGSADCRIQWEPREFAPELLRVGG